MKHKYLFISLIAVLIGCSKKGGNNNEELVGLSAKTGIEIYAIQQLQQVCDSRAERLKTFFTTTLYSDDSQFGPPQSIPQGRVVELPGVCAEIAKTSQFSSRYALITHLNESEFYKRRDLLAFVCAEYYATNHLNKIGVVKTGNQFDILRIQRTEGVNQGVSTDSLIHFIQGIHQQYGVKILGADLDWCEFELQSDPQDWKALAKQIYRICPDIVDQGTDTLDALAEEIKKDKRVFLWWD